MFSTKKTFQTVMATFQTTLRDLETVVDREEENVAELEIRKININDSIKRSNNEISLCREAKEGLSNLFPSLKNS